MPILVTGGTGSIGRMVCSELLSHGEHVVAYDASGVDATHDLPAGLEVMTGDVLDPDRLEMAMRRFQVDRVVHLAVVLPTQERPQPRRAFEVNTMGTLNVIEACLSAAVTRLVFTSSKGAFGVIDAPHGPPAFVPVDEDYRRRPVLIYDISKSACEDLLTYYRRERGLDCVALRFPTLYGPGRLERHGDLAIVSKILEGARAGQPVHISAPHDWADELLYTGDVARGIWCALKVENPGHRTYHIGTGEVSTLDDVIGGVRELYPEASTEVLAGQVRENRACRFDISRARRELGWQPAYDLRTGLRAYAQVLDSQD